MNGLDIDQAVRRVLEGDREAYRRAIELSEVRVRIVLVSILPDPDLVDDLCQETFIHAYHTLAEYRPGTDFFAWIKEIARNLALNERRRWVRRQSATRRYRAQIADALEPGLVAFAEKESGDAFAAVRECLNGLEDRARRVVENFYWRGMSGSTIAQTFGRSAEWTRIVLHRARHELSNCLRTKGILHGS